MNKQGFEQLVDKDKYQVFLLTSPASLPLSFGAHPWFVVNKKGSISRWEVGWIKSASTKSWGHLYLNFLPSFQALSIIPFFTKYPWRAKLIGTLEGGEGSVAHRMAEFIENSPNTYPYCYKYSFFGPNSNTYVQWVLDKFPEFKVSLPRNSFGKKYRVISNSCE